jgi:uracil-DNA glycosylase
MNKIDILMNEIHSCSICKEHLPYSPRPILQFNSNAKILIAGQAPGKKVHESGIPFDDISGDRLRDWIGVDRNIFYDSNKVAILPMGFCYPGTGKSGDLAPRSECAEKWRAKLLSKLENIEIMLVLGKYALKYHFGHIDLPLTQVVKSWREYWPKMVPLPHPSPRNNIWIKKNPWFKNELIPTLKKRVLEILKDI